MTYLTETAEWSEGIRQLETSDAVLGGPDGVDNIAPKQLANRTAYLKKAIEDTQDALNTATKQATEAVQGTAKVASQATVDAGNDDAAIVTPKKLATRFAALLKQATETVLGLAKVATQDQVTVGTDDSTIVTPKKLAAAIAGSLSKQATETDLGSAKIATQALVNTGTDDATIVTPKKLTAWVKQATEAVLGWAKVATQAQTNDGTDDATIVTPKKLRAGFAISFGTNGFVALPSWLGGLIIQWGQFASGGTYAWPIAFPTKAACATCSQGSGNYTISLGYTASGLTITSYNASTVAQTNGLNTWIIAIGY